MSGTFEPFDPALAALLQAEERAPDPPAEAKAAVLSRLGLTVLGGAKMGGEQVRPEAAPDSSSSSAATAASSSPVPAGAGGAGTGAIGARAGMARLPRTLATLLVGAVTGAGIHASVDRPHPAAEPGRSGRGAEASSFEDGGRETPAAGGASGALVPPAHQPGALISRPPPLPPSPPGPAPAARSRSIGSASPGDGSGAHAPGRAVRDLDLAAERTLVEQARSALARGRYDAASAAIERHRREHPRGALTEERESLAVQALVGLGEPERARRAAADFHRRFPRSIFGTVVDDSLRTIP